MGNTIKKDLSFMKEPIPNIIGIEDQTECKLYKDPSSSDKMVKKIKNVLEKLKDVEIPEAETFDKLKIKEIGKICKALEFLKCVGPVCTITLGILEFMMGEEGTLTKEDVISIVKEEVYKELSEMLLIQLKAYIRSAIQHVEDNDLKSAEISVLESLNIMYGFHKAGKFYEWSGNLEIKQKLLFLYKFVVVNNFLLFTYEQLSISEQKENRLKEFAEPVNNMKNFILEERAKRIIIGVIDITKKNLKGQGQKIKGSSYEAYLEINDKYYDSKYLYIEKVSIYKGRPAEYRVNEKKKFDDKVEIAQLKRNQWLNYKENLIAKWKEDLNSFEAYDQDC